MHVFKYSRRKGTKADLMENQVYPQVQEIRSKRLLELSDNNQRKYNKQYIGKELEVLFEEKQKEYIKGHTSNYIVVKVKGEDIDKFHNKIEKVIIASDDGEELIGTM